MLDFISPHFISPRPAGNAEVVGVGGDLSVSTLQSAYGQGIFPWPVPGYPLLWFCPPHRAVLDFDAIHIPKRLARLRRSKALTFTIDHAFERVITACRQVNRPNQAGTWITPPMLRAYIEFHHAGFAHSVEVWNDSGALVGGLYGVFVGGVFSGESMFHREPNASKLALLFLIDQLQSHGLTWMDIQVMTPHMAALGAYEISRDQFLDRLVEESTRNLTPFQNQRKGNKFEQP